MDAMEEDQERALLIPSMAVALHMVAHLIHQMAVILTMDVLLTHLQIIVDILSR